MSFLKKNLENALEKSFQDGDIIFRDGDDCCDMYVVQEGEIAITKEINGKEMLISRCQRGEFIGEMALLESLPRVATARAVGKTNVLIINSGGLLQKIRRDPTFAIEIMQSLSSRFRLLNTKVNELLRTIDAGDDLAAETKSWVNYYSTPEAVEPERLGK